MIIECSRCGHAVHGVYQPGTDGTPKGQCPDCTRCNDIRERKTKNADKQ